MGCLHLMPISAYHIKTVLCTYYIAIGIRVSQHRVLKSMDILLLYISCFTLLPRDSGWLCQTKYYC